MAWRDSSRQVFCDCIGIDDVSSQESYFFCVLFGSAFPKSVDVSPRVISKRKEKEKEKERSIRKLTPTKLFSRVHKKNTTLNNCTQKYSHQHFNHSIASIIVTAGRTIDTITSVTLKDYKKW
jgi:hypothetical protein